MVHHTCLFISVALALLRVNTASWSGLVNNLENDFDYQCPDGLAVTGVASIFDDSLNDRRWEYHCSSGGNVANVSSTCTLQSPVNQLTMQFEFDCPNDGYIGGFVSNYSNSNQDRVWSPYCCTRPYASLIDCHSPSLWVNTLEELLNWTASDDRVLTGLESFYSAFNRDRRWRLTQCKIEVDCGDPGIPANAVRMGNSFLYQDVVVFTCNHGYYQSSGPEGGSRECLDTGLWSGTQPQCSYNNMTTSSITMNSTSVVSAMTPPSTTAISASTTSTTALMMAPSDTSAVTPASMTPSSSPSDAATVGIALSALVFALFCASIVTVA